VAAELREQTSEHLALIAKLRAILETPSAKAVVMAVLQVPLGHKIPQPGFAIA
jgi:hypothetical protein